MSFDYRNPDLSHLFGWPYSLLGAMSGPEISYFFADPSYVNLNYQHMRIPFLDARATRFWIKNYNTFYSLEFPDGDLNLTLDSTAVLSVFPVQNNAPALEALKTNAYLDITEVTGNRVKISWDDIPTDADFESYRIYWDQGSDPLPTTLLVEIDRREITEYTTAALATGTYQFKMEYDDLLGNESTGATVYSKAVVAPPLDVSITTLTANEVLRTLRFIFDTTDEVYIYANYAHGYGMTDYIFWDHPFAINRTVTAQYDTIELWPGQWKFAVCRRSDTGVNGDTDTANVNLINDGTTLVIAEEVGDVKNSPLVYQTDGYANIVWYIEGPTPTGTTVEVYVNDVLEDTVAYTTTQYAHALTVETSVKVNLRTKYVSGSYTWYGVMADDVTLAIDSTAPVGDHVLDLEVI